MLVLTRKPGESIRIGDQIKITMVDLDGANIKVGIEAPRSVSIYREEVYQKILQENQAAVQNQPVDLANIQNIFKKKKGKS